MKDFSNDLRFQWSFAVHMDVLEINLHHVDVHPETILLKAQVEEAVNHMDIAYQWYNYHQISYEGVPLSAYTTGDLASKYQKAQHLYLSVSLIVWSK